jgi:peptidoglycan/LPS O-acetylase OafA/YrhL
VAKKLETVEAGRGLAALLVVLFHASRFYIGTPKYWVGDAFHGLFAFGHLTRLLPSWVGLPILVIAALVGGLLAHGLVEKPIIRALKRPARGTAAPTPA